MNGLCRNSDGQSKNALSCGFMLRKAARGFRDMLVDDAVCRALLVSTRRPRRPVRWPTDVHGLVFVYRAGPKAMGLLRLDTGPGIGN